MLSLSLSYLHPKKKKKKHKKVQTLMKKLNFFLVKIIFKSLPKWKGFRSDLGFAAFGRWTCPKLWEREKEEKDWIFRRQKQGLGFVEEEDDLQKKKKKGRREVMEEGEWEEKRSYCRAYREDGIAFNGERKRCNCRERKFVD